MQIHPQPMPPLKAPRFSSPERDLMIVAGLMAACFVLGMVLINYLPVSFR